MDMQPRALGGARVLSRRSILKGRVASAICLLPALYFAGCAAFALWNAGSYATALPQFLRYVAVPGLLAAWLGYLALRGTRSARVRAGGVFVALLVAMLAFEARMAQRYVAALRSVADIPSAAWMTAVGAQDGLPPAKTPQRVNDELGTVRLEDALLGGLSGELTLACRRDGAPILYRADRYGFRNPDAIYARPVERLLIGDSFVEGICLPDGRDLVGRARALQPATAGLGIRGAGPLGELAILGRFGPAIRPRWVVFVLYEGNDWENLEHELRYPWLRGALDRGARFGPARMPDALRERVDRIVAGWLAAAPVSAPAELRETNLLRNTLALHQTWSQLGLGYPKVARRLPVYSRILARAREIAAGWGGRVALLYVPQTSRLIGLLPDGFVYDQVRAQVAAAAAENRVPFVDLSPAFLAAPDGLSFYGADGHFSERGAALAAALIDKALRGEGEGSR